MIIYGGGGHALVIHDLLETLSVPVTGFFDVAERVVLAQSCKHLGLYRSDFHPHEPMILAIGSNKARAEAASIVTHPICPALVHPDASISRHATFGRGNLVCRGALVQPAVKCGAHVIINTGASVDHECVVGDFCHVAPHSTLCGNVTLGAGVLIGAGATILPGVSIGEWAIVGAGAVVSENVAAGTTVAGVPARLLVSNA